MFNNYLYSRASKSCEEATSSETIRKFALLRENFLGNFAGLGWTTCNALVDFEERTNSSSSQARRVPGALGQEAGLTCFACLVHTAHRHTSWTLRIQKRTETLTHHQSSEKEHRGVV